MSDDNAHDPEDLRWMLRSFDGWLEGKADSDLVRVGAVRALVRTTRPVNAQAAPPTSKG